MSAVAWPFTALLRSLIWVYRHTLSAFVGRSCRHLPTCSEYADDAIVRFGPWAGFWMGISRWWRCSPWGSHGFDPVPEALPDGARWYVPWRYGQWGKGSGSNEQTSKRHDCCGKER
ncbi:MAG: membrane protein insertion efficiency factor YidD [Pseudomonadota bacterium]